MALVKSDVVPEVILDSPEAWDAFLFSDMDEEDDFLVGKTCNPDAPEECESCQ